MRISVVDNRDVCLARLLRLDPVPAGYVNARTPSTLSLLTLHPLHATFARDVDMTFISSPFSSFLFLLFSCHFFFTSYLLAISPIQCRHNR